MSSWLSGLCRLLRRHGARGAWVLLALILVPALATPALATPPQQTAGSDYFGLVWVNPPNTPASPARARQAREIGAAWDRFAIYWSEVQPRSGDAFNWSIVDSVVEADTASGLKMQAVLLGAPAWATASGRLSLDAWNRFVTAAVSR